MACTIKLNYEEVLASLLTAHFMPFSLVVAAFVSTEQLIFTFFITCISVLISE